MKVAPLAREFGVLGEEGVYVGLVGAKLLRDGGQLGGILRR